VVLRILDWEYLLLQIQIAGVLTLGHSNNVLYNALTLVVTTINEATRFSVSTGPISSSLYIDIACEEILDASKHLLSNRNCGSSG
jgi:hypothetical protein